MTNNQDTKTSIPDNVELKVQGSTTLREAQVRGDVLYCPVTDKWTIQGEAGWNLVSVAKGNLWSVEVKFFEPLEEGYTIEVTPTSQGNLVVSSAHVLCAGENGFQVLMDTPDDLQSTKVGFNFSVQGIKKQIVPDDRTLTPYQLIEDINAINNILMHEVEYGMITMMSSASINSETTHNQELEEQKKNLAQLKQQLEDNSVEDNINNLKFLIRKTEARITRLGKLLKSSKYWESAINFGKMWGNYCSTTQSQDLGGRYIPLCTGGGPGIMAGAALGAREQNAQVIGIDSVFGNDNHHNLANDFSIYSNVRLRCNDFAIREAALINFSHVILFWPGGYGTSWEAFETLSKLQTDHLRRSRTKVLFVHPEFWIPFYDLTKHLEEMGTINGLTDRIKRPGVDDQDADEFYVGEIVKDEHEAFEKTVNFIKKLYQQNQLALR